MTVPDPEEVDTVWINHPEVDGSIHMDMWQWNRISPNGSIVSKSLPFQNYDHLVENLIHNFGRPFIVKKVTYDDVPEGSSTPE